MSQTETPPGPRRGAQSSIGLAASREKKNRNGGGILGVVVVDVGDHVRALMAFLEVWVKTRLY